MSSSSGGTTATTLHSVPPCATSRPFTEGSASPCTPSSCVRIMPTVGVTLRGRLTPARRRRGTVLARDRQLVQTLAHNTHNTHYHACHTRTHTCSIPQAHMHHTRFGSHAYVHKPTHAHKHTPTHTNRHKHTQSHAHLQARGVGTWCEIVYAWPGEEDGNGQRVTCREEGVLGYRLVPGEASTISTCCLFYDFQFYTSTSHTPHHRQMEGH
jgi:hypothetical protein